MKVSIKFGLQGLLTAIFKNKFLFIKRKKLIITINKISKKWQKL